MLMSSSPIEPERSQATMMSMHLTVFSSKWLSQRGCARATMRQAAARDIRIGPRRPARVAGRLSSPAAKRMLGWMTQVALPLRRRSRPHRLPRPAGGRRRRRPGYCRWSPRRPPGATAFLRSPRRPAPGRPPAHWPAAPPGR